VHWVGDLLGLATMDAYQLVSQIALSPVANVCDTVYTMVCKIPKRLLGDVAAYTDVHAAMRAVHNSYLPR